MHSPGSVRVRRSSGLAWFAVVAVALVVPMLVGTVVAVSGQAWVPVADDALIALRVRDIWAGHFPLVGVYSRFGWSHPGPALFFTLAPFQVLGAAKGLLLGSAIVATASVAGAVWLLGRRGGSVLGLGGASVLLVLVGALGGVLFDPWNPWIALMPFALLVIATWSVIEEDWWVLPVVVGIASWLVQVHLGYAPMAVGLVIAAAIRIGIAWRAEARVRAPVAISAAIAVVLWLPAVLDQLIHRPGNLKEIITGLNDSNEPLVGIRHAAGVTARGLGASFSWVTGNEPVNRYLGDTVRGSVWLLALPLIVSGLAAAFVWRRRDRARVAGALRFQAIVWGTVILGFVSVARIAGPAYPYLVRWQWVLAALVWLSALWSIAVGVLPEPSADPAPSGAASHVDDDGPRWVMLGLAVACLIASAAATVSIASADVPDAPQSDAVRALIGPALERVRDSGPVLLDDEGSYRGEYVFGLLAELDRRGVEVWMRDGLAIKVGSRRTRQGREPATTLLVVSGNGVEAHLADRDNPLVKYDPLTKRERARFALLDEREARNLEDLVAHREARDPLTPAEESFMRTMRARGEQVAVFVRGE